MDLLERDDQLAELEAASTRASAGRGSVVVVVGEAGSGKTSLVERFVASCDEHVRVWWGTCDDLMIPWPLGPFRDMFGQLAGDLDEASGTGALTKLIDTVLGELGRSAQPGVVILEDAHWADNATLDALRVIGRRIARLQAVLVVTARGSEVATGEALRQALGAIPPADLLRIHLGPLSPAAVRHLAGDRDIEAVYQLTGGNPFYVRAVLANPDATVPPTVQDAVLARVGRLDPQSASRPSHEARALRPGRTPPGSPTARPRYCGCWPTG